jgi:hypothetical protein
MIYVFQRSVKNVDLSYQLLAFGPLYNDLSRLKLNEKNYSVITQTCTLTATTTTTTTT